MTGEILCGILLEGVRGEVYKVDQMDDDSKVFSSMISVSLFPHSCPVFPRYVMRGGIQQDGTASGASAVFEVIISSCFPWPF